MKYISAEKLIAEIEFAKSVYSNPNRVVHGIADAFRQDGRAAMCDDILKKLDSLQQEQPKGNLEYWLEHFGMPKENIDNCITQIAQGYGACRYLEGIQHGAEAVNEIAKQEQSEVDFYEKEHVGVAESPSKTFPRVNDFECGGSYRH